MPPVLTRVGPGLPCLHLLQSSALPCFHSLASLAGLLGAPGRHSVPVGEGPRATAVCLRRRAPDRESGYGFRRGRPETEAR